MKLKAVLTMGIFSVFGGIAQANDKADIDNAISILSSNEKISNFAVKYDEKMTSILREKMAFDDVIITVAGSRMGLNVKTGIVYQLGAAYPINSLVPLQESITHAIMEQPESRDWYAMSGVADADKKATFFIFTDPTCGYCRKMHGEKAQYDELGVQSVVIPWPRGGLEVGKPAFDQWVAVACSVNPGDAYQRFIDKGEKPIADPSKSIEQCEADVRRGFALGQELGVSGTPYVYAEHVNGNKGVHPGYLPVAQIMAGLQK